MYGSTQTPAIPKVRQLNIIHPIKLRANNTTFQNEYFTKLKLILIASEDEQPLSKIAVIANVAYKDIIPPIKKEHINKIINSKGEIHIKKLLKIKNKLVIAKVIAHIKIEYIAHFKYCSKETLASLKVISSFPLLFAIFI